MTTFELYQGDCLEVMKSIPDKSVDLTVTSPPYDNLRTYNGNNEQWGEHVWKAVLADLFRVTKQGGVVVWVVGDATIKGSETGTSFKQALWAMDCGFNLHDTMIYEKKNFPPLTHKRYEQCFEYMFVFVSGKIKTFNPILVESKMVTGGSKWIEKDGSIREAHTVHGINTMKIKKNVFAYPIGTTRPGHPAPFPLQLANDHIISWSNKGDTVLDCFMGSGTTGVACANTNRNFIGIELDPEYLKIAEKRINENL